MYMSTRDSYKFLKKYKVNAEMIAKWFGYKNGQSLRCTSSYHRHLEGVNKLIEHIEDEIVNKINGK